MRVKNVALALVKYCQDNEKSVFANTTSVEKIKALIYHLDEKTKYKYSLTTMVEYLNRACKTIESRKNRKMLSLASQNKLKLPHYLHREITKIATHFKDADDIRFVPGPKGGQVEFYENSAWNSTQKIVNTFKTGYEYFFKKSVTYYKTVETSRKEGIAGRSIEMIFLPKNTVLGKGAQRQVYAAFNLATGEPLALKSYDNDPERRLFEIFSGGQFTGVSKAYATRVFNLPEAKKHKVEMLQQKYIMNLAEMVKRGKFSLNGKIQFCKKLLKGLDNLHKYGPKDSVYGEVPFAHQDIKPQNIFIRENFDPVIGDFGVSTCVISQIRAVGSPMYMSPSKIKLYLQDVYISEKRKKLNDYKSALHLLSPYANACFFYSYKAYILNFS